MKTPRSTRCKPPTSARCAACLLAAALGGAGCGEAQEGNLSTSSEADPARLERARAEADQAAGRARKAEARKFKGALRVEEP